MNYFDSYDDDLQADLPEDGGDGVTDFVLPIPEDEDVPVAITPEPPPPPQVPGPPPVPSRKDRRRRTGTTALGVYVSSTTVYGTLVQDGSEGIQVLRRFARQRNAHATGEIPDLAVASDSTAEDGDVQIKFGRSAGLSGSDLFLDSEFGDLANLGDVDDIAARSREHAAPVVFELKDIIDECASAGYDKPAVAFCTGHPAVDYVELLVPDERARKEETDETRKKKSKKNGAAPAIKRDRLLARLSEEYEDPYDKTRVAFMPMTPREGVPRFLAIIPTPEDPLEESLELLREQGGMRSVPLRLIDSEVSMLVGLTRWAFPPDAGENTAIVRVSAENTLVILMHGRDLHHQEHMLGVTTVDGPDTICSRVLLQQDVQGIGTVHQVVVLSDEREDELVRGFAAFYPDARVEALRRGLREHGVMPAPGDSALPARALPAIGAGLRLLLDREKQTPFDDVSTMPKRLRRVRPKLDLFIAWHTLVVGVVLFFTVLLFMGMYFTSQRQIAQAEERLAAYPPEASMSPQALQAQIDSLQTVYMRITGTLNTIDSLLVGSDRWSRSVSRLARATSSTGGTWVEQWTPQGMQVQLAGHATGRDQVVQFAERMNGTINELRFSEIRDYPVYSYVLTAPIPHEMPEVALYLREQVDAPLPPEPDLLGGALAGEENAAAID